MPVAKWAEAAGRHGSPQFSQNDRYFDRGCNSGPAQTIGENPFALISERAGCAGRYASIDQQSLTCDVATGFAGEEDYGRVQIFWLTGALERNAVAEILDPLFIFVEDLVLFGAKPSRSQAVHSDSMLAPIVGQTHRKLSNPATAGSIRRHASVTGNAGDGSNVDDASVSARDHAAGHGLRHKKASAKICIENQIPFVPGHVERGFAHIAPGIVDQDVEMAKCLFGFRRHAFDTRLLPHIKLKRNCTPSESVYLFLERQEVIAVTACENQIRAGFGQCARHVLTEAAAGSSNNRHSSVEVEKGTAHNVFPGARTTFIRLGSRA